MRFLQGWAAMLPTQLLFFRTKSVAHAFVVPALCKLRKGRGTLGPVSAGNQKPGPPADLPNGEYLITFDEMGAVSFDFGIAAAK